MIYSSLFPATIIDIKMHQSIQLVSRFLSSTQDSTECNMIPENRKLQPNHTFVRYLAAVTHKESKSFVFDSKSSSFALIYIPIGR